MSKRIKLENIVPRQKAHGHQHGSKDSFCPECGERLFEDSVVEEYVCGACRHLISPNDEFCAFCGDKINSNGGIEHYTRGRRMSNKEFTEMKKEL